MTTIDNLMDEEGENQALRMFLAYYGGACGISVGKMQEHLRMAGFDGAWPEWCNEPNEDKQHLTKAGAQLWIRHLISLEALAQPNIQNYPEKDISAQPTIQESLTVPETLAKWANSPELEQSKWHEGYEAARAWVHVQMTVGQPEKAAQPAREQKKKDMEWMLTNAFYRMYNHGKNGNPVSAQCEVQALGMYLRGEDMQAWRTSVVDKPSQPAREHLLNYDKTMMNAYVQNLYDKKMRDGRNGHYETMFHVVHSAIKRAHGIGGDK